jgi:ectoine hydroxylase-related dioxygenase (phytanoyl-CoA dioxygenase family)
MRIVSQSDTNRHLKEMNEQGYSIIEEVMPKSQLKELQNALSETIESNNLGYSETEFEGTKTVRIYNLLAYHRAFEQIPTSEITLPIVEQILDKELQLSSISAICLGPGQAPQPIHGDSQMIPLPRPHIPISVNSMWALSDFTEENGATRIVPGSHQFDHHPEYMKTYQTVAAEMPAGSILLWNSALWHGGGENLTQQRRDGIACYYCAGWVRPQENQQLGLSMSQLKSFDRRLQELCSFSVYKGIYGHVDNEDPIKMLGQQQTRGLLWQASDKKYFKK